MQNQNQHRASREDIEDIKAQCPDRVQPEQLFKYYVIRYVPDVREEAGIEIAVAAVSESRPSRIVLKQLRSWARVLELDAEVDVDLLNAFLKELPANLAADPRYMDRALQWENCIRVLPPKEFSTNDFEGTFSLLSNAELGIE